MAPYVKLNVFVLLSLIALARSLFGPSGPSKILLTNVQSLTLYRDQMTTARRGKPIPQLQLIGSGAGCHYVPPTVQCSNKGTDGTDVQWECKAELPTWCRFGAVQVSCEGFDSPNDPYILVGSCGLEFRLESTDVSSSGPSALAVFIVVVIVIVLILSCLSGARYRHHYYAHEGGGNINFFSYYDDNDNGYYGYGPCHSCNRYYYRSPTTICTSCSSPPAPVHFVNHHTSSNNDNTGTTTSTGYGGTVRR